MTERLDLAALRPNPNNPRTITEGKKVMLAKALKKFGDLGGLVYNRRSQTLVGGHQRRQAFLDLDAHELVVEHRYEPPTEVGTVAEGYVLVDGERFSYREVDWPATTEHAANLASNKGAGEFSLPLVADWLGDLHADSFDLDLTMFDADEVKALLEPEQVEPEPDPTDDEVPEPGECHVKLGDVYTLGRHRLVCGDSSNTAHLDLLLQGQTPDLVFTDPPYGMNVDTNFDAMFKGDKAHRKTGHRHKAVHGDDAPFDAADIISYFFDVPEMVLWGADYYRGSIPDGGSWYVWDKRCDENMDKVVGNVFELAWSKKSHKREVARILWSGHHGMHKDDTKKRVHPTQKPVELVCWLLTRIPGNLVCDPFAGSGSTLMGCEKMGRSCLAMELDPTYVATIIARWQKATGGMAELVGKGMANETVGGATDDG